MSVRVCIVCGGPSSEAAVSRKSAEGVLSALRQAGYQARCVELGSGLAQELAQCDVAFPVTHGPLGEDGCLQGLLEVLDLPYVGSDVRASAIAAHKPTAKVLFRAAGLPVAAERLVLRGSGLPVAELIAALGTRLVVKPASGGSAIGVTRVVAESAASAASELERALATTFEVDSGALVETFHEGLEVTCGVLERDGKTEALPPTLVHSQVGSWYDFTARYQVGGSRHECPAPLGEAGTTEIQSLAVAAHHAVGARDLSRIDFVYSPQGSIVLEVNTLPGMTQTSNYPEAAAAIGISFSDLCAGFVKQALARPRRATPIAVPIPE